MQAAALTLLLSLGSGARCDPQVALRRPTLLGLEPLRTPFAKVDQDLRAPALRLRDPAEGEIAPFVVCLKGGPKGREAYLLVESSAAGGYGMNTLTGLRLSLRPPNALKTLGPALQPAGAQAERCAATPSFDRSATFSNGLRLGMSREDVTGLLGRPTETRGSTWHYQDERRATKNPACPAGTADYAEVSVTFGPDGVTEIHVERSDMR